MDGNWPGSHKLAEKKSSHKLTSKYSTDNSPGNVPSIVQNLGVDLIPQIRSTDIRALCHRIDAFTTFIRPELKSHAFAAKPTSESRLAQSRRHNKIMHDWLKQCLIIRLLLGPRRHFFRASTTSCPTKNFKILTVKRILAVALSCPKRSVSKTFESERPVLYSRTEWNFQIQNRNVRQSEHEQTAISNSLLRVDRWISVHTMSSRKVYIERLFGHLPFDGLSSTRVRILPSSPCRHSNFQWVPLSIVSLP